MGVEYPAETPFPIVDPDPGPWKGIQHFRRSDWTMVAGLTAGDTVIGYYMGRSSYMHRPCAVMGGVIGLTFGIALGLQNSMGRLMGRRDNEEELGAMQTS